MTPLKLVLIGGARPNFMKIAPLVREFTKQAHRFTTRLIHTGQHYDESMSEIFFKELEIPPPDVYLGVGSGSHASQTARIMEAFEKVLESDPPDWVVVVGDVNSTLACAIVAAKMSPPVKVAHVEAGLRSRDRTMPEEINRIVTDTMADLLFTTSADADRNLLAEGIALGTIHRVGNVMIDTLKRFLAISDRSDVMKRLGIGKPFALLTLHRPSNVDEAAPLRRIFAALGLIAQEMPIVFPAHPRTLKRMQSFGILQQEGTHQLAGQEGRRPREAVRDGGQTEPPRNLAGGIRVIEPLGYIDFLHLQKRAALVFTDSGGIQEETTILGVPCLTLRENTERPVTVTDGTNRLVGSDTERILREARRALRARRVRPPRIPLWDGRAAARIAAVFSRLVR